jgi:hypothetical protein
MKALAIGLAMLCAVWIGSQAWQYLVFPEDTVMKVINACSAQADKMFASDAARSVSAEQQLEAGNPFRKAYDKFVEDCVAQDGRWCVRSDGTPKIWPCPWGECFLPTGELGRLLYNLRYRQRADLKCLG